VLELLATSQFHFRFSRVEVSHEIVSIPIIKEGEMAVTSVDRLYRFCSISVKNSDFASHYVLFCVPHDLRLLPC
jgi:hypothetical protein